MLLRLLVAVLMLVGPLPLRVCTCAASTPAAPATTPTTVKKCRCADCHPVTDTATRDTGPTHCEAASPSAPHDHDCPAVNPRPVVRDLGTPPVPGTPIDAASVAPEPLTLTVALVPVGFERAHAPRTPLYITFLVLRN